MDFDVIRLNRSASSLLQPFTLLGAPYANECALNLATPCYSTQSDTKKLFLFVEISYSRIRICFWFEMIVCSASLTLILSNQRLKPFGFNSDQFTGSSCYRRFPFLLFSLLFVFVFSSCVSIQNVIILILLS